MELIWKQRIVGGCGTVAAIVAGWQIANGSFGAAAAAAGATLLFLASRASGIGADALVAGAVLVGYLAANRGFAQLHPPNLPLLPAEAALGLGATLGLWRWARSRVIPIERDWLNFALIAWIALSAIRLPMDFRQMGLMAIRDFAMVYYALFFFLAQDWSRDAAKHRWMEASLAIGLAVTTPVCLAFLQWPEWFITHTTIAGNPLIFIKGDVAGAFMAAGVLWYAERYTTTRRVKGIALAALCAVGVVVGNSRAAVVALGVGLIWLVLLRRWRSVAVMGGIALVGLTGLSLHAAFSSRPWQASPLYRVYQSTASMVDVDGTQTYVASLEDKPGNNQFRLVWWQAVIDETWADGRWLGLGFGHDLAAEFLRVYYADDNDDFNARSPHNFLFSVFGRTGLLGFAALLTVLGAMAARTWRTGQEFKATDPDHPGLALWLVAWAILASACFGVILEGPMGAVVFWIALGLANARTHRTASTTAIEEAAEPVAALPAGAR